jgi:hypothetical protein
MERYTNQHRRERDSKHISSKKEHNVEEHPVDNVESRRSARDTLATEAPGSDAEAPAAAWVVLERRKAVRASIVMPLVLASSVCVPSFPTHHTGSRSSLVTLEHFTPTEYFLYARSSIGNTARHWLPMGSSLFLSTTKKQCFGSPKTQTNEPPPPPPPPPPSTPTVGFSFSSCCIHHG